MQADDALGTLGVGRQFRDRDRRGVRREESRVGQQQIELLEDLALYARVLEDRLDDGVTAVQILQRRRVTDPPRQRLGVISAQLLALHGATQRLCEATAGAIKRRLLRLVDDHLNARGSRRLRDPRAHEPGPHHCQSINRHACILSVRAASRR